MKGGFIMKHRYRTIGIILFMLITLLGVTGCKEAESDLVTESAVSDEIGTEQVLLSITSDGDEGTLEIAETTIKNFCEDSDAGKTYTVVGSINGQNKKSDELLRDYCVTDEIIAEYYCTEEGYGEIIVTGCTNALGYSSVCQNNICIAAPTSIAPYCGDTICQIAETYTTCYPDCDRHRPTNSLQYPYFFTDVTLVVGDNAPSTDVITATLISGYFNSQGITTKTILASEASMEDLYTQEMLLIGNPCENEFIMDILYYTEETCTLAIPTENTGLVKFLQFGNNEVVIITGFSSEEIKDLSTILRYQSYILDGTEVWVYFVDPTKDYFDYDDTSYEDFTYEITK